MAQGKARQGERPGDLVKIEGTAKRHQSFNLPHEVFCEALGECRCSQQDVSVTQWSKSDQQRHLVTKAKLVCSSFAVGYREVVEVPRAALGCPEVASALKTRALRIRE